MRCVKFSWLANKLLLSLTDIAIVVCAYKVHKISCGFSNKVIPKLRDLPEDSASKYYEMLIKCVVKWGWCTQLMEVINGWMVPVDRSKKDDNNGQVELCDVL